MLGNNKGEKGCRGGSCRQSDMFCACNGHYMWLRWVIGIFIIAGVFWLGIQIGSVRSAFNYEYMPYQMMRGTYPPMMQQWGPGQFGEYPMMQRRNKIINQYPRQQQEGEEQAPEEVPQAQ